MKSIFKFLVIMLLACTSCDKIIDWAPIDLRIYVQDTSGKDLLDPENDNTWAEGTTLTFQGNESLLELNDTPQTKDLPAVYEGFRIEKDGDRYLMVYGEIYGGNTYRNEEFIIRWPDGTEDIISLTRRMNNIKVSAKNIWKLNGEKTDFPIVIVK